MEVKLRDIALAAAAFAAIECALILYGVIPAMLSYSLPSVIFSMAYYAILALAGWQQAGKGWLSAAKEGAAVAAARMAVVVVAALIGVQYGIIVLGATFGGLQLPAFLIFISAVNIFVGALIVAAFSIAFRYSGQCGNKTEKRKKEKK
jgi:hypothetical protein